MTIEIRPARAEDDELLTRIAFSAKRSWNYPEEYFSVWEKELTITKEYISRHEVFVACSNEKPVAFYSLVSVSDDFMAGNVLVKKGYWMDHLFVLPQYQKRGIGKKLMEHALNYCHENWYDHLKIFVDPNAVGFYKKMGASFIEDSPSSIPGRTIPVYGYTFEE
jgi:maltose O-acetyltransferase